MTLNKVRVQLLDIETGEVIEEVDVLTSADAVMFSDGETFQQKLDNGTLKGDPGAPGEPGIKGDPGENAIWHFINSTGAPTNTIGNIGDWAINTAGQTYEKTGASIWTSRANIKGPKGDTGAKGDPGDNVRYGTTKETSQEIKIFFKKI